MVIASSQQIIAQKQERTQNNNMFNKIDIIALKISDSLTFRTSDISMYMNQNFSNKLDRLRAIFIWISKNIDYDVENMFEIITYTNEDELIRKVLETRKGICSHYAELFSDIANKSGIKTYVISGYTKQNGQIDNASHAWCASLIDTMWVITDPTWGAGYVQNSKYFKKVNNSYFNVKPEIIIKSHMPFDPLWQFLYYPITNQEFYDGRISNISKVFFNYSDSLLKHESLSDIEKLTTSTQRIKANGIKNILIRDKIINNTDKINVYNENNSVDKYNYAVSQFNIGVDFLNKFISYRNNQFEPKKTDAEIKQMVDTVSVFFNLSLKTLNEIKNPNSNISSAISQLKNLYKEAEYNLNEQKIFVEKYINTSKIFRKTLFRKYTWMGIPLN